MGVKMNSRIITVHETDPEIRVSHKIDFKAVWPHNGHADSVGVKCYFGVIPLTMLRTSVESSKTADKTARIPSEAFCLASS